MLYEGIYSLCFCCGRLGHKQENFCYQIKQQERRSSSPSESPEQEKVEEKVGMAMGRVRAGFFHTQTRPAGQDPRAGPSPFTKRIFFSGTRTRPHGPRPL